MRIRARTFTLAATTVLVASAQPLPAVAGTNDLNYAQIVRAIGASAYWRFDETSGLTLADSSGNGNDAILPAATGITLGVPGASGTGLAADGSQDPAAFGPITFTGQPFSIEFSVRLTQIAIGGAGAFLVNSACGCAGAYLGRDDVLLGGMRVGMYSSDGLSVSAAFNGSPLAPGALYHLVFTTDGAAGFHWYVDGTQDDGAPSSALIGLPDWDATLPTPFDALFADSFAGTELVVTLMDEAAIYPYALTPAQAAMHAGLDQTSDHATLVSVGNLVIVDLAASVDPSVNTVQAALVAAPDADAINGILEAVQPDVSGSGATSIMDFSDHSALITSEQLASVRTGTQTGMAAGNAANGLHAWAAAVGNRSDQENRGGVPGYSATTWGGVVGLDSENAAHGDATIGGSLGYGRTDAESDNANRASTDLNSYQFSLYGEYELDAGGYISGQAAYGWSHAATRRTLLGNPISGDYDANTFGLRAEIGRDYSYGDMLLTPMLRANWMHYSPDDYVETGAGGLTVRQKDLGLAELGIGVKGSWTHIYASGSEIRPELRLAYRHDFIGDRIETTSNFNGVAGTFTSQGPEPAQDKLDAGASLTWTSVDNWDFRVIYDVDYKADYLSQSALIKIGYRF